MTHPLIRDFRAPITDEWLAKIGFKHHRFERQPTKHWLLWLGSALDDGVTCYEDLGIELAAETFGRHSKRQGSYYCWLRSDAAGRYHRFIHTRRLKVKADLLEMIRGLTGQTFDPDHAWYGRLCTPAQAERLKQEQDRLDIRLTREGYPWHDSEKDDTKGGPLIEHMRVADEVLKEKGD